MTDIVERLYSLANEHFEMLGDIHEPLTEAADEISRLRKALLKADRYLALGGPIMARETIADVVMHDPPPSPSLTTVDDLAMVVIGPGQASWSLEPPLDETDAEFVARMDNLCREYPIEFSPERGETKDFDRLIRIARGQLEPRT